MDLRLHWALDNVCPDAVAARHLSLADLQLLLGERDDLVALACRRCRRLQRDGAPVIAFDVDRVEMFHHVDRPVTLGVRACEHGDGDGAITEMPGIPLAL